MEHTVIHDEKVDRFEVFESGQIAYLQYDEKNGVLDILHTIGTFIKYYKISQLIHTQSIAN